MTEEEKRTPKAAQETYAVKVDIPDVPEGGFSFRVLWKFTGPGLLMSIAYLDPGNIESDLQSGAVAQFKLIWVLLLAHVLGLLLQRLAARLGVVSGKHMAEIAHSYYPKWPRLALWIMVEIAIIGSDMQEVIGTAISLYLLSDGYIPLWAGVLITICDTFTFLFLERYGVRKFEAFFAFLIACMAVTFGFEFVESKPDAGELFTGMVLPWCSGCGTPQFLQGVAVVGAVIMPHNLYLHSALVKSRAIDRTRESKVKEANKYYFIESFFALFCSFWINVLVVAVFGQGLYGKTNADVKHSCDTINNHMPDFYKVVYENNTDPADIDIFHAGIFLGCTFGVAALYVWAIGILAAGQSSTMTGTYAGQFAMEGFIQIKLPQWKRILVTRSLAIAPTLLLTIFSGGIMHMTGLNDFLNSVQMIQLPFALIPVLTFVSDKRVMFNFKTSRFQKGFAVTTSLVVLGINFFFLYEWVGATFGLTPVSISITAFLSLIYVLTIIYLSYYCLVAMGIIRRLEWAWLPEPRYQDFDAPWLEVKSKRCQAESYENSTSPTSAIAVRENGVTMAIQQPMTTNYGTFWQVASTSSDSSR
nr:Natural resistance-associated macrophage protein domain containing protein [Haemonchus contortus]